ncbi:hypothetical protein [Acidianus manzaensis]|nr:hypothetical protein [Acidianus manzaensis]
MKDKIFKSLEYAKWSPIHTWSFISFSIGMALESYIFGIYSN